MVNTIDMRSNNLDDDFLLSLGEYLQDNHKIETIYAGSNKITDKGVEILSSFLPGNITLRYLGLSLCKGITDKSAPYFLDLAKRSCITFISLNGTSMSDEKQKEIKTLLQIPIQDRKVP